MKGVTCLCVSGPFLAICCFFAAAPQLSLDGWESNGWPRVAISEPTNRVYTVESSTNLINWAESAVLHGRHLETNQLSLPFIDPKGGLGGVKFYRVHATPIDFEDDWRNHVYLDDGYRNDPITHLPETRWIKFAMQTNEPTRVYYQNSFKYKFHYNFAVTRLPAFGGLTPAQFDAISLRTNSQKIVLGAVLFSPFPEDREVGIQFVGQDAYRPEEIARWFEIVRSTIHPLGELNVRYFPSFEQTAVAESNRAFFAGRGIQIGSLTEWDTGANAYSTGWAAGRLVFVPGAQIAQAYANGTLKPDDILLTDSVPAEIPYVAGILTLSPTTPNSHVAILARSYFVPFVYLADTALRAQAQAWVGRDVAVTAFRGFPTVAIRLIDLSAVDPVLREEIADAKRPEPLNITPKARYGSYTAPTETLVPADIQYFGGKAANFGFLRRQIPTNSPEAIAISFDLWDDFMSQTIGGVTLREQIAARLGRYSYPPNVAELKGELAVIRDMIEDDTSFTPAQQQAIVAALLGRFEPQTRIRFRSSTNVEDAENFTGAGLYDSYSGCLADDQDGDSNGPSRCDPSENNERGVFRAIRKVYASFYNDNAVLERMRHSVDESKVGMAILVHYSAPDPTELANGVATINFGFRNSNSSIYDGELVTQKGAVSVTNPDGSALPELMAVSRHTTDIYLTLRQGSTLVPFGAKVLSSDAEYKAFANLFSRVATAYRDYYPQKGPVTLDFEYKKLVPGVLQVKQVREIPRVDPDVTKTTYLLNAPGEWQVFQGEYGNVFANHRLKGLFQFQARDLKLTTNALQQSLLRHASIDYILDGQRRNLSGDPVNFPSYAHSVGAPDVYTAAIDSWTVAGTNNQRRMSLSIAVQTQANASQSPLITLADARIELRAVYSNAVPVIEFGPQTNYVTEDLVFLTPRQSTNAQSLEQIRIVPSEKGAAIRTSFYWPQPPTGIAAGYTAPLIAWKETRIEGLTTEPIVLRDYYSQTYRPEHHNFSENFLFEPALEPGISAAILAELRTKDIRQIYVYWGGFDQESVILVAGENGQFRPLVGKTAK